MADKKETVKSTINMEEWASFKRNDIPTEVNGLMRNAYLQYSVSANIGRAIPDVRDGLKPGARRILYAMLKGGYGSSGGTNKCAKVVGLVIGNYHPHGDTAVYDTMVRMAQNFSMRVPLIYGHGNFGSMDGDPAAAYRYTECKMEKAAEALLADLDKETVDMRDTFDAKEQEPTVLPAAFPNLLVNGSQGIGVGMATNIPPHNLGEAIDAAVAVIDNPNITVDELMEIIPGPDYPTGGIIHGVSGVRKLYATGQGVVRIRGKVEIEADKNGKDQIVITEIPFGINKSEMVGKIGEMARNNVVHGISSIVDLSSDRVGVKIVITLKQDATTNVVLNELYKLTPLESTDSGQLLVVDHNRPRTMTLKQILDAYIDHREEVITRRTRFLLNKAKARAHVIEGLFIAQANIDEVIAIIRQSDDRQDAQTKLMARFPLDDTQTNAILDMRLAQLSRLAVDDLQKEFDKLTAEIARLEEILSCRANIMAVVRKELLETKEKFNTPRRTRIEGAEGESGLDGLTKREIYMVTLTKGGYIKRCNADEYEAQRRGGSGVKGITARKEGDTVQMVISTRSHNSLLFFTNYGKVYRLARAYELPESKRADAGRFISNVLNLIVDPEHPENHEEIRAIISYDEKTTDMENTYVVMVTKKGLVKRSSLALFKNLRKYGKKALVFREDDDLIDAQLTDGSSEILISTRNGRAIRFYESNVRSMGTAAAGVRAVRLLDSGDGTPDSVVSLTIVQPDDELLVITEKGLGKRTPIGKGVVEASAQQDKDAADGNPEDASDDAVDSELESSDAADSDAEETDAEDSSEATDSEDRSAFHYRLTKRGAKGIISIKLRDGDHVVAALQVEPDTIKDILLLSERGQAVRTHINQIRLCGRTSYGVKVMTMSKENDKVVNVSIVDELSDDDAAANAARDASEIQAANEAAAFEAAQAEAENAEPQAEADNAEPQAEAEGSSAEEQQP